MSTVRMKTQTYGCQADRPSPAIWGDCPIKEMAQNPGKGRYFFEDFHIGLPESSGESNGDWYYISATSVASRQKDVNGVFRFANSGTDQQGSTFSTGNNVSGLTKITSKMPTKWWYEARFKVSTVGNEDHGLFIGLAEEGLSAINGVIAETTGALQDKDIVGFHTLAADGDDLAISFRKEGQDAVTQDDVIEIAADTWYKVGFKYEPQHNEIHIYLDGERVGQPIDCSSDSFPSGEGLALYLVNMSLGGSASNLDVDWVGVAHENY